MRKQPPATSPVLALTLAALALAACTADAPAPTAAEVDALAQSVKDAITTDALMSYSAAITEHVRPSGEMRGLPTDSISMYVSMSRRPEGSCAATGAVANGARNTSAVRREYRVFIRTSLGVSNRA